MNKYFIFIKFYEDSQQWSTMKKPVISKISITVKFNDNTDIFRILSKHFYVKRQQSKELHCYDCNDHVNRLILIEPSRGVVKRVQIWSEEVKRKFLSLFDLEILSYNEMYSGNIGFKPDIKLLEEALFLNGIEYTISAPLADYKSGIHIHFQLDFDSINKPVEWSKLNHRCFDKNFNVMVKELLLITKYRLYIPKDIVINVLIPILARIEQKKYIGKRGTFCTFGKELEHSSTIILTDEKFSTNGITNIPVLNYLFYLFCQVK